MEPSCHIKWQCPTVLFFISLSFSVIHCGVLCTDVKYTIIFIALLLHTDCAAVSAFADAKILPQTLERVAGEVAALVAAANKPPGICNKLQVTRTQEIQGR